MKKSVYLLVILLAGFQTQAQFGNMLKNAAKHAAEKAGGKIINHMAEKGAEAVADKLISKWNAAEQEGMKRDYDSIRKANPDAYKDFDDYANSLNKDPNVLDEYHFDMYLLVESAKGKKKPETDRIYFSTNSNLIGMAEGDDDRNITVLDYDKDMMVAFHEEAGEKSMQAIPSFQRLGGALAGAMIASAAKSNQLKVVKTGKTKTFAGYRAEEYKSTYNGESSVAYFAPSFPVKWNKMYGKFFARYMSQATGGKVKEDAGMLMYSQSKDKKGRVESTWEVKKVVKKPLTIKVADYQQE